MSIPDYAILHDAAEGSITFCWIGGRQDLIIFFDNQTGGHMHACCSNPSRRWISNVQKDCGANQAWTHRCKSQIISWSRRAFSVCIRQYPRHLFVGVSLLGLLALAMLVFGPVSSAIEIGTDEHYELTKAFLWAKGFKLYDQIWNDQPPLYTALLGQLFRWFGPGIGVARGLATSFGLLLFAGSFMLVRVRCGFLAAILVVLYLLVAPGVLELSLSAMLEVPAMAVGLLALWPLHRSTEGSHWYRLVISAALLGTALQIKLTAAVFAPALCAEILLSQRAEGWRSWCKKGIRVLVIWGASLTFWFLFLSFLLGSDFQDAWRSHFSRGVLQSEVVRERAFSINLILDHTESLCAATFGLVMLAITRQWRSLTFPCLLLGTVAGIHLVHRPWWPYYYLHFAIPLAWLSAYGLDTLLRSTFLGRGDSSRRGFFQTSGGLLASSALVATLGIDGGDRFCSEIRQLRLLPRVEDSELISEMRAYAPGTRWIYTQSTIYAFHAGLTMPPPLAVLVKKRFWSGAITEKQIAELVTRYQPEQILLPRGLRPADLKAILTNYIATYRNDDYELYVANALATSMVQRP